MARCESFSPTPKNNQKSPNGKKQPKQVLYKEVQAPASVQKKAILNEEQLLNFETSPNSQEKSEEVKW